LIVVPNNTGEEMVPLASVRATLTTKVLGFVLCGVFLTAPSSALPVQAQLELNEAGRKIKTRVVPEYPPLARRVRLAGVVRVELVVTPEGTVKEVKELGGNPVLLEALIHAVKQWKYEPAGKESVVEVKAAFSPST
jgi:TonB family protein